MGSAARILDFQNVLSWASSRVICSSCMSLRTPSIHLPLGLPLGLFPGTLMSPTALTSLFSSILCMCPYQRSLISLTFSCMLLTPSSFLMPTLFTLSLSVTYKAYKSFFSPKTTQYLMYVHVLLLLLQLEQNHNSGADIYTHCKNYMQSHRILLKHALTKFK